MACKWLVAAAAAAAAVAANGENLETLNVQAGPYTVLLTPFGDNSIRIQVAPPGNIIQDPPLSALYLEKPPVTETMVRVLSSSSLSNGNLAISIDNTTGLITATRISDNTVLVTQTGLTFAPPSETSPGTRIGSQSASITLDSVAGEKVFGLGEHRTGTVEMLGPQGTYYSLFQNSQLYGDSHGGDVSIPWYMSSRGYGMVWNSPAYGYAQLVRGSGFTWMANATMNVDFWLTTTPDNGDSSSTGVSPYVSLLSHYVDAVGHAPTMPFYSTGFIQCKDRYRNQSQILEVAQGYVDRELPISVIVQDWFHWVNQGDWSFNPACFPDPQGMIDQLSTQGITFKITFWPFQTTASQHWNEFHDNGYLVPHVNGSLLPFDGDQYLYDSTNPVARAAVFAAFQAGYGKFGIKTIWLDASEPERFDVSSVGKIKYMAGTDSEVGEAWVQQHVRTFADGFASVGIAPEDYYVLPRHAWAGSWRYSAGLWSGDISSSFEELSIQIRVLQGTLMSGVALWTTDIGGYNGGDPTNPEFQDLIVRWFQFGAFCPLFRLHGHRVGGPPSNECGDTNGDNEVWNLAQEPAHYNGIVAVMRLRENLRQYVADINAETASTGLPMSRAMFLQWPNDAGAQGSDVEDQFMFGPSWLVAPQYTYQATSRSVYLPALDSNHSWIYFFNQSDAGSGGARVDVWTPIDEFPLFYIQPIAPVGWVNMTALWSSTRSDQVLCAGEPCYNANSPGNEGDYVSLSGEGWTIAAPGEDGVTVRINGTSYPVIPLNLAFSHTLNDNWVSSNTTYPDPSYASSNGGTNFANGWVLTVQPPGAVALQVWSKAYPGKTDWATVSSPAGLAWVAANGYAYRYTTGYVFTTPSPPPAF